MSLLKVTSSMVGVGGGYQGPGSRLITTGQHLRVDSRPQSGAARSKDAQPGGSGSVSPSPGLGSGGGGSAFLFPSFSFS